MTKPYIVQVRPPDDDTPEMFELIYVVKIQRIQASSGIIEQYKTDVFQERKGEKKFVFTPITDAAQKQMIRELGE